MDSTTFILLRSENSSWRLRSEKYIDIWNPDIERGENCDDNF
jgi:hypothetical protein